MYNSAGRCTMNASKEQRLPTLQDGRRFEVSYELEIVLHDACSIIVEGRPMMLLPGRMGRGRSGRSDGDLLVAFQISDVVLKLGGSRANSGQ